MYVSVDRNGQIREAYPLNSDNAGLQDAARDQLLKAQLKSAVVGGQSVQTEAALTFEFSASFENNSVASNSASWSAPETSGPTKPIIVSPMIANSLRSKMFAPVYPQDLKMKRVGGKVELTAIIGKQGQIVSVTPLDSPNDELTQAAIASVQKWTYKPFFFEWGPRRNSDGRYRRFRSTLIEIERRLVAEGLRVFDLAPFSVQLTIRDS